MTAEKILQLVRDARLEHEKWRAQALRAKAFLLALEHKRAFETLTDILMKCGEETL